MSDTDAILQSEYDRIQSSDDWYAYLGTILRNMPGGASVKMLTKEMRSLCSDPNRQIKYNPFRANDWDFALNSCVVNFRLFGNRFVFCMSKKEIYLSNPVAINSINPVECLSRDSSRFGVPKRKTQRKIDNLLIIQKNAQPTQQRKSRRRISMQIQVEQNTGTANLRRAISDRCDPCQIWQ